MLCLHIYYVDLLFPGGLFRFSSVHVSLYLVSLRYPNTKDKAN